MSTVIQPIASEPTPSTAPASDPKPTAASDPAEVKRPVPKPMGAPDSADAKRQFPIPTDDLKQMGFHLASDAQRGNPLRALDRAVQALSGPSQSKYPDAIAEYIRLKRLAIVNNTEVTMDDPTRYIFELSVKSGYVAVFLPINKAAAAELGIGLPEDAIVLIGGRGMWILPYGTYTLDKRVHKPNNHPKLCESTEITEWKWQEVEDSVASELINKAMEQRTLELINGPLGAQIVAPELEVVGPKVKAAAKDAKDTKDAKTVSDAKQVRKIEQVAGLDKVQIQHARNQVYEIPKIQVPKNSVPVREVVQAPWMNNLLRTTDETGPTTETSMWLADEIGFKIGWRPIAEVLGDFTFDEKTGITKHATLDGSEKNVRNGIVLAMNNVNKSYSALDFCKDRVMTLLSNSKLNALYPECQSHIAFEKMPKEKLATMIKDFILRDALTYGILCDVQVTSKMIKTDPVAGDDPNTNGHQLAMLKNITLISQRRADGSEIKVPQALPGSKSSLAQQPGEINPEETPVSITAFVTLAKKAAILKELQVQADEITQNEANAIKDNEAKLAALRLKHQTDAAERERKRLDAEEKERVQRVADEKKVAEDKAAAEKKERDAEKAEEEKKTKAEAAAEKARLKAEAKEREDEDNARKLEEKVKADKIKAAEKARLKALKDLQEAKDKESEDDAKKAADLAKEEAKIREDSRKAAKAEQEAAAAKKRLQDKADVDAREAQRKKEAKEAADAAEKKRQLEKEDAEAREALRVKLLEEKKAVDEKQRQREKKEQEEKEAHRLKLVAEQEALTEKQRQREKRERDEQETERLAKKAEADTAEQKEYERKKLEAKALKEVQEAKAKAEAELLERKAQIDKDAKEAKEAEARIAQAERETEAELEYKRSKATKAAALEARRKAIEEAAAAFDKEQKRLKEELEEKAAEAKAQTEEKAALAAKEKAHKKAEAKAAKDLQEKKEREEAEAKAALKKRLDEEAKFKADHEAKMEEVQRQALYAVAAANREERKLAEERDLALLKRKKEIQRHEEDMKNALEDEARAAERRAREKSAKEAEIAHYVSLLQEDAKIGIQNIQTEADKAKVRVDLASTMLEKLPDPDLRSMLFMNFVLGVDKEKLYQLQLERVKAQSAYADEDDSEETSKKVRFQESKRSALKHNESATTFNGLALPEESLPTLPTPLGSKLFPKKSTVPSSSA